MTNKERYQRTFRTLHASGLRMEEVTMKKSGLFSVRRALSIAAVLAVVLGLATAAYAFDVGGLKRAIQIWFHGDLTDAVLEIKDGSYTLTFEDEAGEAREMSGGGVELEPDGTERPLTAEEMMEELDSPDVVYKDDGSVWVYYHNQTIEITDKFENGFCFVKVVEGKKTFYMTIKYKDGYGINSDTYPDPKEF